MSKPNNASGATPAQTPAAGPTSTGTPSGNHHPKTTMQGPTKSNVTALPGICLCEGCKKRAEKANFCMEHFDWFKEGLITKEGRRPTDFDKKYFDYTRRLSKRKAG